MPAGNFLASAQLQGFFWASFFWARFFWARFFFSHIFFLSPCCVSLASCCPFFLAFFPSPFSLTPTSPTTLTNDTLHRRDLLGAAGAGAGCLALNGNSQSSDTSIIHSAQWLDIPTFNLSLLSPPFDSLPSVPATRVAASAIAVVSDLLRSTGHWAEELQGHSVSCTIAHKSHRRPCLRSRKKPIAVHTSLSLCYIITPT